jgi:hypothetical protein
MLRLPRFTRICLPSACLALVLLGAPAVADAAPTVSIGDVTHAEGNSGGTNASFTVTLSEASSSTVTVNYATENGTAVAPNDYASSSGTVTFAPMQTSATIPVAVIGDTLDEANETFNVNLSSPSGATIADGQGTGTITDDDPTPSLRVNDASVAEGNSGTRNATFTVSLSAASGRTVTVNFGTSNGSAVAGADYNATGGTLTIPAGSTSRTVSVAVRGDTLDEANESFNLNLSGSTNATVADGRGVGTIRDDDAAPSLVIRDAFFPEGHRGRVFRSFQVVLSRRSGRTVTVRYGTSQRTARSGSDYTGSSGTVTINAGSTVGAAVVPIIGDLRDEPHETFVVTLSRAVNASIRDGTAVGTILDDEFPPAIRSYRVSPNVFRAIGGRGGSIGSLGALVRFRLTEAARVTFRVQRFASGRRVGRRCVAPTRSNRRRRPCIRYLLLRGSFGWSGRAGFNFLRFTGRLRGRRLPAGRYRLLAYAVDPTGLRSATRRVYFRITR